MEEVKALEPIETTSPATGKPQRRRVVVLRRDDGHFSFAEQYFFRSVYEGELIAEGWQQSAPEGIFATADIAEAEGLAAFLKRYGDSAGRR